MWCSRVNLPYYHQFFLLLCLVDIFGLPIAGLVIHGTKKIALQSIAYFYHHFNTTLSGLFFLIVVILEVLPILYSYSQHLVAYFFFLLLLVLKVLPILYSYSWADIIHYWVFLANVLWFSCTSFIKRKYSVLLSFQEC